MGDDGSDLIETLKATAFKGESLNAQMTALMVVRKPVQRDPWTKRDLCAFPEVEQRDCARCWRGFSWARIINDNPQFDGMEFAQPDRDGGGMLPEPTATRQHGLSVLCTGKIGLSQSHHS